MLVRFGVKQNILVSGRRWLQIAYVSFFALILYPVILFLGIATVFVRIYRRVYDLRRSVYIHVKVVNIPNQYWKFNILVNIRTVDDVV